MATVVHTVVEHDRPWLRACHGPCEGLGHYAIKLPPPADDPGAGRYRMPEEQRKALDKAVTDGRLLEVNADGWAWLVCDHCDGRGYVSRIVAAVRLPRLLADWAMMLHTAPRRQWWDAVKQGARFYPAEIARGFTWDEEGHDGR